MRLAPLFLALCTLPIHAEVVSLECTGRSMLPYMPERATVRVDTSPAAFDRIAVGSVVIYRHPQHGLVSHYVFRQVRPGVWWTRGTNNRMPDTEYVTRSNFIGLIVGLNIPTKTK